MIVEEQGIDFRTGVRFPSAPLLERPHNCWKIQCLCGFLVFSRRTKRKPKRLKKRLFSGQISHEVSHEKRAKKASKYKALRAIIKHKKGMTGITRQRLTWKNKRTRSTAKGFRVRFCDVAILQFHGDPLRWTGPGMVEPLYTIPDQSAAIDPGIFRKERPELLCIISTSKASERF